MGLRCFVAVELPGELKEDIYEKTLALRRSGADVKWVPAENLHITLKFLGEVGEDAVSGTITKALGDAASLHRPFELTVRGAGTFPPRGRPRVVWVGVQGTDGLVALHRDVQAAMAAEGFEPDTRPFKTHITIGRVRSPRGGVLLSRELVVLGDAIFGKIGVQGVSLMRSRLLQTGAEYSRLAHIPLVGAESPG